MPIKILDSHFHFYDTDVNTHPFLEKKEEKLALIWGEHYQEQLPRAYLPRDYMQDTKAFELEGLVMAELVSTDPLKEMHFAQKLSEKASLVSGAIANINLRDKNLPKVLNEYLKIPIIRSVRDHLLWDPYDPNHCYTDKAGILLEPIVQESFRILQDYPYNFEFEIYEPDIPLVAHYAGRFPTINFALHCLGWPLDQSELGFSNWKEKMQALSKYQNVFVKITAIECIFGLGWSLAQIEPWLKTTIKLFGASHCMFGSHLPISKLSKGINVLYQAYQTIVSELTIDEQQHLFANTAKNFYRV